MTKRSYGEGEAEEQERLKKRVISVWGERTPGVDLRKFCTAEEIADFVRMSAKRLRQLADDGFVPHIRIDGGEPLFSKPVIRVWVNNNLVEWHAGDDLPPKIVVYPTVPHPPPGAIPQSLIGIQGLRELPAHHIVPPCVYFLILDREVVYVGKSISLASRVGAHRNDTDYFGKPTKTFDHVFYVCCPTERLEEIELAMIHHFKPKYNRSGLPRSEKARAKLPPGPMPPELAKSPDVSPQSADTPEVPKV